MRTAWGEVDDWGRVVLNAEGWIEAVLRGADAAALVPAPELADELARAADIVGADVPSFPPVPDEDPETWHARRASRLLREDGVPSFDAIAAAALDTEDDPVRRERLHREIALYRRYGMETLVRIAWLIVQTCEEAGVALGCGRGSSCASYLLYRLGLHMVDPVEHGIDPTEFIRPKEGGK